MACLHGTCCVGGSMFVQVYQGETEKPYAKGKLRNISRAKFVRGPMAGRKCVVKWFPRYKSFREVDLQVLACKFATAIVQLWNAKFKMRRIHINESVRWMFADCAGHPVLLERFVDDFRKWNSNSGWTDNESQWGRIMQALSHFSYHASGGNYLICDLQGSFTRSGCPIITSPTVCSSTDGFGLSDLGPAGIRNFFHFHECNEYCNSRWKAPKKIKKFFSAKKSTTFWNPEEHKYVGRFLHCL